MRLRIISGTLGGRTIFAPDGVTTHPMGERVRNAMFNSIGEEIKGAVVLDAFAGSGSVGLEAISRGASTATFLEKDPLAGRILEENVKSLGVSEKAITFHGGVGAWTTRTNVRYDIIIADPPYNNIQLSTVVKLFKLLKPNGLMVLSYPGRGERPTELESVVVDSRSYGTVSLAYYRKKDAS
ncbi:MAG TPA: 16S rRNA (guanine(966)-N(2))-methyltransferase RsmD [Candidatus Saccharibacteria bacterium]|nr:16S rRNA (guanine(966)-N(2))-methyltransferase RsmD [Candidatus Saccharibacteria bacterium]HRQ98309.1 16S rRNA (guanine(966)-N(2))-methyltransferase RsmD [Candidatus Saccharibacteria bacterium]